mgnify:CR=1 FL=1
MRICLLLLSVAAWANDVVYLWPESQRVKGEETIKNERIASVPNPTLTVYLPEAAKAMGSRSTAPRRMKRVGDRKSTR